MFPECADGYMFNSYGWKEWLRKSFVPLSTVIICQMRGKSFGEISKLTKTLLLFRSHCGLWLVILTKYLMVWSIQILMRMKRLLPSFVYINQSAFVQDMLLMENVLLASVLVKSYHKPSFSARCAVKIDILKAFDSVQWPFLLSVLEAMNRPEKFILWIKKCIELSSFSVQINGELAGYFNSKRGLRQGMLPFTLPFCDLHASSLQTPG